MQKIKRDVKSRVKQTKIDYLRMYIIQKENMIYDNTIAETIRLIDTQNEEYKYAEL